MNYFDHTVNKIDTEIWNHFFPNFKEDECKINEDNCLMFLESDIENIFYNYDIQEAKEYIIDKIYEYSTSREIAESIIRYINWDKCVDCATIRKDFASALKSVKKGSDLSHRINWGFSDNDIKELSKLHKANRFRRKIEDLLTDCNFHTECSLMHDRKYDEINELLERRSL